MTDTSVSIRDREPAPAVGIVAVVLAAAAGLFGLTSWLGYQSARQAASGIQGDYLAAWATQTGLVAAGAVALVAVSLVLYRRQLVSRARLEASERRHRTLFIRSKVAMLLIDPSSGAIVDANDAACHFYGYPFERLTSMAIGDINTLEPDAVVQEMVAAEQEGRNHFFFRHRLADGEIRDVEVHSGPLVLDGRRLLLSVVHDITAHRRAEALLDESEQRFRSLVEGTSDWVWETDADHRCTWLSPTFEANLGVPAEMVMGKRRSEAAAVAEESESEVWRRHRGDLAARRPFRDFRYWFSVPGHAPRWLSVSGAPRYDKYGRFVGYRGIGTDVTAVADDAQRLRLLSKVVEQSPVAVVVTGLDFQIEYVNPHLLLSTGYSQAELIGHDIDVLADPGGEDATAREIRATVAAGHTWLGEARTWRKDGSTFWDAVVTFPVTTDGGAISHYVSVREDITFRKEAESRISESNRRLAEQARLLKQSNTELEQFAYVTSHDLRQPLRMVTSYLGLIERRLGAQLDGDLREFFGYAAGGAKRMDALIVDLLEYSRIGRQKRPFVEVPLAEVVADSLTNLRVAIAEAEAEVTVAEGLPRVSGDRTELGRLFLNLIGNAIKYRRSGQAPCIKVSWSDGGDEWVVAVGDNGIGIRPEDYDRAFGIFQRLVPDDGEGTGIGLAVCKKIVERHQGRIWVESVLGEGSSFKVALPKLA